MNTDMMTRKEIDLAIATKIMKWHYWDFEGDYDGEFPMFIHLDEMLAVYLKHGNYSFYFNPSTDITAADLVIDKMEEMGFSFHMRSVIPSSDAPVYIAHFGDRRKSVTEFTRPLAICHAALATTKKQK